MVNEGMADQGTAQDIHSSDGLAGENQTPQPSQDAPGADGLLQDGPPSPLGPEALDTESAAPDLDLPTTPPLFDGERVVGGRSEGAALAEAPEATRPEYVESQDEQSSSAEPARGGSGLSNDLAERVDQPDSGRESAEIPAQSPAEESEQKSAERLPREQEVQKAGEALGGVGIAADPVASREADLPLADVAVSVQPWQEQRRDLVPLEPDAGCLSTGRTQATPETGNGSGEPTLGLIAQAELAAPDKWDLLLSSADQDQADQDAANQDQADQDQADQDQADALGDELAEPSQQDAVIPRRGRRAASRPAGPPVTVQFSGMIDELASEREGSGLEKPDAADAAEESYAAPKTTSRASRRATRPAITVSFSAEPEQVRPVEPIQPAEISTVALFKPPEPVPVRSRQRLPQAAEVAELVEVDTDDSQGDADLVGLEQAEIDQLDFAEDGAPRRRRRRGGRRRRRGAVGDGEGDGVLDGDSILDEYGDSEDQPDSELSADQPEEPSPDSDYLGVGEDDEAGGSRSRRRRRRRRAGITEEMEDLSADDPPNTVVKVRSSRARLSDEVVSVRGSTRIEAKKQRRRDGREASRRRPPILTEAEFLARREAVNRVMAVRQNRDRTQIAVLEDGVLCEHYVNKLESSSLVGNVYLGKVQNVLPSMEAAFVDIGRGRNAVLYAGEVNWDAAGLDGQPKRIELALKAGDAVLVQATKDPMGHKGSRLTSQVSLPGRFLVYVPEGSMTGISRKLPDTERARLKAILKEVMPEGAGVIVRTAAEGASEEQLTADVRRLAAQWDDICRKAKSVSAPSLLYGEPDLAIKVVRDIFNEDFTTLVVQGEETWATLNDYIGWVAPDLASRMVKWVEPTDLYTAYRIDEQLAKALDRKVWLPSGGSLVIDRTEAMTVIDVNTGKFTGQGGNLEETVTRNNLEAAEEIVRQLRLRDIGGIIVVDFIDMVLESNRDLVLRRLVECLGRDRTRHQVAEVTSLGLVQMTRKRIGQGLLEVFSTPCEVCNGRGHVVHSEPVGVGSDSDFPRRRDESGASRRTPTRARLRAPLGGKQTGKSPPPPKFDAEGHIYHDDDDAVGRDSQMPEPDGSAVLEPGAAGALSGPTR